MTAILGPSPHAWHTNAQTHRRRDDFLIFLTELNAGYFSATSRSFLKKYIVNMPRVSRCHRMQTLLANQQSDFNEDLPPANSNSN